ncbi:ornithine decarboxylase [Bovine gammaherpesvirus 6]|uniref:Ornithine decarboxylase n=1 Tax=Bovine gammaherpesvirus 6 TaxID=1504288 RepID=A0A060D2X4_9GAMA|nr:ornithine decarboxylase [Bovine gammaherpesvirus 6]AIB03159.1 ornithine decarboxylase [Bovine gammaherpesvirus 6]
MTTSPFFTRGELDFHFFVLSFADKNLVKQKIREQAELSNNAFCVIDLGEIVQRHFRWLKALPKVIPFYAVKAQNDERVLKTLAALKTGFDCASKQEIQLLQNLGVHADRILFANPCKQPSHITYAAQTGVRLMTFDSEEELTKIDRLHHDAKLVLRIKVDDSNSDSILSVKFGAPIEASQRLLKQAKKLGLEVIGVSFHVGSGCKDAQAYRKAIAEARRAFDFGTLMGFDMYLLDIGGGFPGINEIEPTFEDIAEVINAALERHFPDDANLTIIGEPGRYYATSALTIAVTVIAKKCVEDTPGDKKFMYYVNDGVYGSFNCILFNHARPMPMLLKEKRLEDKDYVSSIWGPSCDGLDCIVKRCELPELQVGDWLIFENMGAYSLVSSSTFNGFPKPEKHYVISEFSKQMVTQVANYTSEYNDHGSVCMTSF